MQPFRERLQTLVAVPDRLLWAVRVRWLAICGFLLLTVVAHACGLFVSLVPAVEVTAAGSALNWANGWCIRRRRYVLEVSAVAIPSDHVLITYLIINTGGVHSPFLMLYVVEVLATAMLVDTVVAAASAVLAILVWFAGVSWEAAGYLSGAPLFPSGAPVSATVYQGTWAAFLLYCLALLVYVGGYISERLRSSERDLADKNRRLQDALASLEGTHQELTVAYDRLKQTEAHLIQSEKMRGLGQLVAGVAHELNNPISFVSANVDHLRGYTDRLRQLLEAYEGVPLPADERARIAGVRRALRIDTVLEDLPVMLADCEEGTRRTKRIVGELRTFSRSDEREVWQPVDVHRGIESTLGLLAHRLKDRITVHRDFGGLSDVEGLPGPLNQVFMNLLANAADAIGNEPGNIWITARVAPNAPGAASGGDPTPMVIVAVRDDGPGIPPEIHAKVFDPFFTTKEVGRGMGLGLSVSYSIVARHHGTLTVQSPPGAGATFTVTLPVKQPQTQAAPAQAPAQEPPTSEPPPFARSP